MARPTRLTPERILAAAQIGLDEVGHEALSLRAVARGLGVTAPALYDHFDSKDALLRSLAEQGFRALIEATDVEGERAIDRVRQRAFAYVEFATANAELFRLMFLFRPAAVDLVSDDGMVVDNELGAATDAFDQGAADLARAIDDGDLAARELTQLAMIMWATVHGVATIALTAPSVAADVCEPVVDTMLRGLRP